MAMKEFSQLIYMATISLCLYLKQRLSTLYDALAGCGCGV
jgi:hypothetical protein